MKKSGTYKITIAHRNYYGSSTDLLRRKDNHKHELKKGIHANEVMQRAFDKYDDFQFEILELCAPEETLIKEQPLLDRFYRTEGNMNLCPVAANSYGYKHTEETRKKMSAWQLGRKLPASTLRKKSELVKGFKNPNAKLTQADHEYIRTSISAGGLVKNLAVELKVSRSSITRALKILGLKVPGRPWTPTQREVHMRRRRATFKESGPGQSGPDFFP